MSRLPKIDKKPKNNRSTKFRWVDSQWEKFIDKQKLDAEYIENLECVISEMTDMEKLEIIDQLLDSADRQYNTGAVATGPDQFIHDHGRELEQLIELDSDNKAEKHFKFLNAIKSVDEASLRGSSRFDLIFTEYVKFWHSFSSSIFDKHKHPKIFNLQMIH